MPDSTKIPPELTIPYCDEDYAGGFVAKAKNSAKRRNMTMMRFLIRKIFNTAFYWLAYVSPFLSHRVFFHKLRGVKIGKNVKVHIHCKLDNAYPEYIILEDDVSVNQNTTILTHSNPSSRWKGLLVPHVKPVLLKKGCMIGLNSTILPGIRVGYYSIVSAGSVVTRNVPDFTVVAGNPAKKIASIKNLLDKEIVNGVESADHTK